MQLADSVEITTLVDDYVNGFLSSSEGISRARLDTVCFPMRPGEPMLAEFGWSSLVKIRKGGHTYPILFDTGLGKNALLHNARALKIDLKAVEAVIISHGHPDHTAASLETVSAINRDELPIIMHPKALTKRAFLFPNGERIDFPFYLDERKLHDSGGKLEWNEKPTPLASESVYVTGEIPRVTSFEKGMPANMHYSIVNGELVHDPLVLDDQGLVINVKDKGLVVISGCAHAGIVNTLEYAKRISGVSRIHAVVGGFHLTGKFYQPIIDDTVNSIRQMAPKVVIPSHCTGLRALVKIANAFPDAFVENSVGSTFSF
ncbi:MAG: MBL fold metallo-hydrolase [Thaumarchaeota archaeon]|nr:MBL fold metallo-hydrolase [Nitrososphaerota archaeon]